MDLETDANAVRARVNLMDGETAFEGWAVNRGREAGLVWITNMRVVFVRRNDSVCALPISKIDRMYVALPTELCLEAWHQHLQLAFSAPGQCSAFRNLLRQDRAWRAAVESA